MEELIHHNTHNNISYIPSAIDLLWVLPRWAQRAGTYAFYHMPDVIDTVAGKIWSGGGSIIAGPTAHRTIANATMTSVSTAIAQVTTSALESTLRDAWSQGSEESASILMGVATGFGKLKNFGGIFSYMTSRWALTTFTAAVVLNRTQFYASSRDHLRLRVHMRLALYLIPILAFLAQLLQILQALKCQTSPDYSLLRYGDPLKHLTIDFAAEGGLLYHLSSTLLFWQDDASCCHARSMSLLGVADDKTALRGSMSLLYWFFLTLCTSQLFETLACALQGRLPKPETGMTIFEHSLAFAECEAMISSALGFGLFGLPKGTGPGAAGDAGPLISRSEILQRLNVPPEVLLICLISCFSHISSAALAIVGIRDKVRLVNTAVWACCYMSAFVWSFSQILVGDMDNSDLGFLRFPTVCLVGFIPHMLILTGITMCGTIYGLAMFVTVFSIPSDIACGMSVRQRFSWAYHNLQANVQFSQNSSIRIKMSEDFYTTLLKIGFNVLTAASEAVYLNEGSRINIRAMTWLEQKRIDELATSIDKRNAPAVPSALLDSGIARGLDFVDHPSAAISPSPYARERKSKPAKTEAERQRAADLDSGLGLSRGRSRMQLTFDFIAGILGLTLSLQAHIVLGLLRRLGMERQPPWLLRIAGVSEKHRHASAHFHTQKHNSLDFYILGDDGSLALPRDSNVDVELETRRMMLQRGTYQDEQHLGNDLYKWWRAGGWYGELDGSGEYAASAADDDDDTTSMISMSTNASTNDDDDDDHDHDEETESGRRTPTQRDPFGSRPYRESSVEADGRIDLSSLSRLLNPQSSAEREEARLLSYSLQSDRPLTRSQFRRKQERSRAELLTGLHASSVKPHHHLDGDDEERDLEHFILSQRSKSKAQERRSSTWQFGAEGMGESGPQCVVCQCSPRTVLVWPCGCLSMCDDCRVGLAARNYTKCICCRTDIAAYSRLYVP